jgi:hypothetical protein
VKLFDGVTVVVGAGPVEPYPRPQDSMSGWAGPEVQSAQSNWEQNIGLVPRNQSVLFTNCFIMNLNIS